MKKVFLVGLILFVSLIAGCIVPPDPDPNVEHPIAFSEIENGKISGITEKTHVVVNDSKAWNELYKKIHSNSLGGSHAIPYVDFEKYTVIAVFMGEQPNQQYSLEIQKVTEVKGLKHFIKVYANEIQRKTSGETVPALTSQPYELIKIKKTDLRVEVERKKIQIIDDTPSISIPFSTLEAGNKSKLTEKNHWVFNDEKSFNEFYFNKIHYLGVPVCYEEQPCDNSHPFPPINFDKYTVIVVSMGEYDNEHSLKLTKVFRSKQEITVYANEIYKPTPYVMAYYLVQPYEIIKIEKTNLPVEVIRKQIQIIADDNGSIVYGSGVGGDSTVGGNSTEVHYGTVTSSTGTITVGTDNAEPSIAAMSVKYY